MKLFGAGVDTPSLRNGEGGAQDVVSAAISARSANLASIAWRTPIRLRRTTQAFGSPREPGNLPGHATRSAARRSLP